VLSHFVFGVAAGLPQGRCHVVEHGGSETQGDARSADGPERALDERLDNDDQQGSDEDRRDTDITKQQMALVAVAPSRLSR
jgi:hypothetical protein